MSGAIHVRKFMGGQRTPQEVHRELLAMRCLVCTRPASIRVRIFARADELPVRDPELMLGVAAHWRRMGCTSVPTYDTKFGRYFLVSDSGFCDHCATEAERQAARRTKSEGWMFAEIDRGPRESYSAQVPG